jgi:hypothetical protein
MTDLPVSSDLLMDRLGHEELRLKQLGLVNHAAGVRAAIVQVIKLIHETKQEQGKPPD